MLPVTVKREPATLDRIFTSSVIILVSIIFINFGCALDLASLKQAIMRPVGPVIGLVSHFVFLPLVIHVFMISDKSSISLKLFLQECLLWQSIGILVLITKIFRLFQLSYALGELLFPENRTLRLGLFFTGISPAGGASNIWTYSLGGNLNLSVTMTAVSTLASFGIWLFLL